MFFTDYQENLISLILRLKESERQNMYHRLDKHAWIYLLTLLILILILFSGRTLARYMSSVSGTGTATIATPVVAITSVSSSSTDVSIGEPLTYKFTVSNTEDNITNELTMNYSITPTIVGTATTADPLLYPSDASWTQTAETSITLTDSNTPYHDSNMVLGFDQGTETHYYILEVTPTSVGTLTLSIDVVGTQQTP